MKPNFARIFKTFAVLIGVLALWGMECHAAPLNDNFVYAQPISDNAGVAYGTNIGATKESGEPNHAGNAGGKSVWYRWIAPNSGTVEFDTGNSLAQVNNLGSDFDTLLGVYTGSRVDALTFVGSNDNVSSTDKTSQVKFAAVAGTTYYIAVDGFQDPATGDVASGTVALSWTLPPPNDTFANAPNLPGTAGRVTAINLGATKEPGEPNPDGNPGGESVWFRWVAPSSGMAEFDTEGSSFDTILGVYTGNSVNALTTVANGRDIFWYFINSQLKFTAVAGMTYYIAVDGLKDRDTGAVANGTIFLNWAPPPPNDDFANAQMLPGTSGSIDGTTSGATSEPGEPDGGQSRGRTIWYRFTAPASGLLTFDSKDAELSLYTGASLATLTSVADTLGYTGAYSNTREFDVSGGATFYIELNSGYDYGNNTTLKYNFIADAIAPTVTITHPVAAIFINSLRGITGTVADNAGGSGVRKVNVYLRRRSDGKYWNGIDTWVTLPVGMTATLPTTGNTWSLLDRDYYYSNYNLYYLPNGSDLLDGGYAIQAIAIDQAGNHSTASLSVTADQTAPVGSFTTPADQVAVTNLNVISGRAADGGSGVSHVDLQIQRHSDAKYWTGTTWSATPTVLKTILNAGVWTRNAGNPGGASLLDGDYSLLTIIYDQAQNVARVQNQITVGRAVGTTSGIKVSSATANVADYSAQLKFSGAIDPESASDPAHYRVTVNGRVVGIESAGYNAANRSVTLALAESLSVGDTVVVTLDGVVDTTGATVAQSVTLRAQWTPAQVGLEPLVAKKSPS